MPHDARVFRVHGRVQGVGFRWWARSLALRLEIHGSVRNLSDGSVELVATGHPERVDELRRQLHEGPPGARVDRVEEGSHTPDEVGGFRILD